MRKSIFVIAEAGVNHNGDPILASRLIDVAVEAGADAVKFQTFKAEKMVTKSAAKAAYQKRVTSPGESQRVMLKRLELSHEIHREMMRYCDKRGIQFLTSAFDMDSLNFVVHDLGLRILKIPSGEITNAPLLLTHARTHRELIVSTGMSSLGEIEDALGVLAFGLIGAENPSKAAFEVAFSSKEGQDILKEKVTLLHCTTEYPTLPEDVNLHAMETLRRAFGLNVGYSDHSLGISVPIGAAALGAVLIEKHITLDRSLPGPDHGMSLQPDEFAAMVDGIRTIEQALGDGLKGPRPAEFNNRKAVRRSLVAKRRICLGDMFSEADVTVKRPGTGRSPMEYWALLGTQAQVELNEDDIIP